MLPGAATNVAARFLLVGAEEGCVHGEIVHRPAGLDAVLANNGCELGVVTDTVQHCVKENRIAVGGDASECHCVELKRFFPIEVRCGEKIAEDTDSAMVGMEARFDVFANFIEGSFRGSSHSLRIAKFDDMDVVYETSHIGRVHDIAVQGECVWVLFQKCTPAV